MGDGAASPGISALLDVHTSALSSDSGYLSSEDDSDDKRRGRSRAFFRSPEVGERGSGRGQAEVLVVLGDEGLPLVGDLFHRVDRLDRAGVDAEAAVDALLWMDVEHLPVLVLAVDAIHRANVHAGRILHSNARFS